MIIASTFISDPHRGQRNGSISYTFESNLAQAFLYALSSAESASGSGSELSASLTGTAIPCSFFHSGGARSATSGIFSQFPLIRDEYKPYRRINCTSFGGIYCVSSARKSSPSNNMKVFFEIIVVAGVEQHPSLEWFVVDFLQRNRWPGNVFCKSFPRFLIKDTDTIVYTET